jgi:hypothetical protein
MKTFLTFVMSLLVIAAAAKDAAPAGKKAAVTPADPAAAALDKRWRGLREPGPRFSTRELFEFTLEAAAQNWHPERVERALALAEQKQDRDPQSKTFGNFSWYWEDPKPIDLNAAEFAMQRAALTWILYRDRLSPKAAATLQRLMEFSIEGMKRHKVSVDYTNIFVMKTWNCIALGENTGRPELARSGYAMFDEWLRRVRQVGVREYLSPTYYAVDFECLGAIARHAQNPAARAKVALALEYLWTDVAANWFTPAGRLGGAHSRDYDYVTGHGNLDQWAARSGWTPVERPATDDNLKQVFVPAPERLKGELLDLAPHFVRQRWGDPEGECAANWVGREVSLASSGAIYRDPMDKTLVVLFGGGAKMAGAEYLMDARQDPYGQNKIPTGGGHNKSFHVQPFIMSVQNGPEALLLTTANADGVKPAAFRSSGSNLVCCLSHFTFPAEAQIFIGASGAAVDVKDKLRLPTPDTPVFLKVGHAVAALRFVYATTPDGTPAPVELVNDGAKWKTMRLTAIHSEQRPRGRVATVLWTRVAEQLDDAKFAAFRHAFAAGQPAVKLDGATLDVKVPALAGAMRLKADLKAEKPLVREGAARGPENYLLEVNGRELGAPLLDRALAIPFGP